MITTTFLIILENSSIYSLFSIFIIAIIIGYINLGRKNQN